MFIKGLIATLLAAYCAVLVADDTELYNSTNSISGKPQVLIIFDNSGTMQDAEETYPAYDSEYSYDSNSSASSNVLFWKDGTESQLPDPTNSNHNFLSSNNNCNDSIASLDSEGTYTGTLRAFNKVEPNDVSRNNWDTLKDGLGSQRVYEVDCEEDELNLDPVNPGTGATGYPINGNATAYAATSGNVFINTGDATSTVTLYTENYLYYRKNRVSSGTRSRLDIAQEAIIDLIKETPSVDFGLQIFNHNFSATDDGGRIIDKVQSRNYGGGSDNDSVDVQNIYNTINNLQASTSTPLCESLFEAYRYFAGKAVYFGDEEPNFTPPRDTSAEADGLYISPFAGQSCSNKAYVIIMTDGLAKDDNAADELVKALPGSTDSYDGSYLASLSHWLNNNDIDGDDSNGKQTITTYTIGFGSIALRDAVDLLKEAGTQGGGQYFAAEDSSSLNSAFQETIVEIQEDTSSISTPSISTSNSDRTRSLDALYYSMFSPSDKSVWSGNIKKLTMNSQGVVVDRNGVAAIADDGDLKETASTYWGGDEDGRDVEQGGVKAMFDNKTSSRKVLSNIANGNSNILLAPNKSNLSSFYGASNDATLAAKLKLEESELSDTLSWLIGVDVDDQDADASVTDYRNNIFADPLHSQPLAVTYTENGNTVTRLLIGTNAGFVHMFTDNGDTVTENWAFIPEELLEHGLSLRADTSTGVHKYGMDLSPIAVKELDADGDVSQIIAIFGMRRGGGSYYAIDITTPNSPTLAWKIDSSTTGFEELADTWSIPSSGQFLYKDGNQEKSVPGIVFGAGYDIKKDTCEASAGISCDDSKGRGVFIVNALTGSKIWSAGGDTCADDDLHCMRDSIASEISVLDSNSDGYIDRLYTGDTGGNLWRMDLVGTDTDKWSTIKLAALASDSAIEDRRFFVAPSIVRTYKSSVTEVGNSGEYSYATIPYDGVLIGSGDATKPKSDLTVNNYYFSLHDYTIAPTLFGEEGYMAKPSPLSINDLYSVESDPVGNASEDQVMDVYVDLSAKSGWKYGFSASGEKSLGQGVVLNGVSYFTSFVPPDAETDSSACGAVDFGEGFLYGLDLHTAQGALVQDDDVVEKISVGAIVPGDVTVHAGVDEDDESVLRFVGVGKGDSVEMVNPTTDEMESVNSGTIDSGAGLVARRIYSYYKEN